jgi:glycosyltransferase involved in cell wall biosynthesis
MHPGESPLPQAGRRASRQVGDAAAGFLSVAVITKNEAHRIERCLRSVAFADQVVVIDSGSTDDTVAVARRLGAEVQVTPDWPGFGRQKNRALAVCRCPWVLSIDADEEVSQELRTAILAVVRGAQQDGANGYWIRRSSRFCGQTIRFGLWRNDQVLRLFRREGGRFTDDLVHERVICAEPMGQLAGTLYHDSVDSIEDAREKTFRYARAGAIQLRARGKGGRFSAWTHAIWSFVRGYLLRLGFLDGRNGLILACLTAQGTYWRYRWAGMEHDLGEK